MNESVYAILSRTQLFDSMTEKQMEAIAAICESAIWPKGYVLIQENEMSDALYIVGSGRVEITMSPAVINPGEEASSVVLAELLPGQVFGEVALVDQGIRSATAKTASDNTLIVRLPRMGLINLCESDPVMGYNLMKNLAADLAFKMRNMGLTVRQYQLLLSHSHQQEPEHSRNY
jgi:CRP/FNR family transcriptional regulator, cyclic AMP receptor protein